MTLITSVSIQNFKCYRDREKFELAQSNFFVGANNAGKSAVLKAFQCFFDDAQFSSEFINKTELRSRGSGYNRSVIELEFDLREVETKRLQKTLTSEYGSTLTIAKNFTFRENTLSTKVEYTIKGNTYEYDTLPPDISKLLSKISVSYIHPQESKDLLERAQEKLRRRLISNWGRNAQLADTLRELQTSWDILKQRANSYLSTTLTNSLQEIWPGCSTNIDLPDKIDEIIAVSDISFRGSSLLPDVTLTSQGTGAQSTILYQTHFLLDSDKTLHRGFYYPIWLIEEPESFLHADIIFKLGNQLCSDGWLDKVQMFVSTHSPILLATTKKNGEKIRWFTIHNYELLQGKKVSEWSDSEIREIGKLMGDPNFDVYFDASISEIPIIIEDTRQITEQKFIEAGIQVTRRLSGVSEMRRYFDVLRNFNIGRKSNTYFLVDNDKGIKEFANVLKDGHIVEESTTGFKKYQYDNAVFLIVFPNGYATEELFNEHESVVESCANQIFNATYTHAATDVHIAPTLTRAHSSIRNKTAAGLAEAKDLIRSQQDVKDIFWNEVATNNWRIRDDLANELKGLLV